MLRALFVHGTATVLPDEWRDFVWTPVVANTTAEGGAVLRVDLIGRAELRHGHHAGLVGVHALGLGLEVGHLGLKGRDDAQGRRFKTRFARSDLHLAADVRAVLAYRREEMGVALLLKPQASCLFARSDKSYRPCR